jgi:CRP-like cAMP-binding protein
MTPGNRFLSQLPSATSLRLMPHLERVDLVRKGVLFRAYEPLRYVYLPETAVISLVSALDSGAAMEVGLVGRDGVAGVALLPGMTTMPCDAVVEIAGVAYRIDAETIRRQAETDDALSAALGRLFIQTLARGMQMLLCNRFHSVEQRCVRRLVHMSELVDSAAVPLTHESFAAALGVRRPSVTVVFRTLARAGVIDEMRGRVTIRDRVALEAACCQCCRAMVLDPVVEFA